MSIVLPDFLEDLIKAGIQVTIEQSDKYADGYYFDLNLQSKSHMHLFRHEGGQWRVDMRYGEEYVIEEFSDLLYSAKKGMHGRDFIHYKWEQLLVKHEYLKVHITTTKSYS
jgi:hypothetical protein